MKKIAVVALAVLSTIFIGCATTGQVSDVSSENSVVDTEETQEIKNTDKTEPEVKTEVKTETKTESEIKPEVKTEVTENHPADTEKDDENQQTDEKSEPVEETQEPELDGSEYVKEVSSLDAACRLAKFDMKAPKSFAVYKTAGYTAISESKINILYVNTKNKEESFTVRKGIGNLDVSEDVGSYKFIRFDNYGGIRIMLKGTVDERYNVATWTSGDYSYSVESNVGFPKEVIYALIQELN